MADSLKVKQRPSSESILALLKPRPRLRVTHVARALMYGPVPKMRFVPAVSAASEVPRRKEDSAASAATREEEHAVSHLAAPQTRSQAGLRGVKLGPLMPKM